MIAAALTLTVFVSLTILTFFVSNPIILITSLQTKFELTVLSGLMSIMCHVLIVTIPMFIVFREKWIYILVCCLVIILISIFLIYDTQVRLTNILYYLQLIAGGRKYGLSYDDYIVGALLLYTVSQKFNHNSCRTLLHCFSSCLHSLGLLSRLHDY